VNSHGPEVDSGQVLVRPDPALYCSEPVSFNPSLQRQKDANPLADFPLCSDLIFLSLV